MEEEALIDIESRWKRQNRGENTKREKGMNKGVKGKGFRKQGRWDT